jgi:hypothetical protein
MWKPSLWIIRFDLGGLSDEAESDPGVQGWLSPRRLCEMRRDICEGELIDLRAPVG